MKCTQCGKDLILTDPNYFVVGGRIPNTQFRFCSPSCLVEWAWKEKEAQEKLSKSKQQEGA